jgi:hypothetical protein
MPLGQANEVLAAKAIERPADAVARAVAANRVASCPRLLQVAALYAQETTELDIPPPPTRFIAATPLQPSLKKRERSTVNGRWGRFTVHCLPFTQFEDHEHSD